MSFSIKVVNYTLDWLEIQVVGDLPDYDAIRQLIGQKVEIVAARPKMELTVAGWLKDLKANTDIDKAGKEEKEFIAKAMKDAIKRLDEEATRQFLGIPTRWRPVPGFNDQVTFGAVVQDPPFSMSEQVTVKMECPQCRRDRRPDEKRCWWCERVF